MQRIRLEREREAELEADLERLADDEMLENVESLGELQEIVACLDRRDRRMEQEWQEREREERCVARERVLHRWFEVQCRVTKRHSEQVRRLEVWLGEQPSTVRRMHAAASYIADRACHVEREVSGWAHDLAVLERRLQAGERAGRERMQLDDAGLRDTIRGLLSVMQSVRRRVTGMCSGVAPFVSAMHEHVSHLTAVSHEMGAMSDGEVWQREHAQQEAQLRGMRASSDRVEADVRVRGREQRRAGERLVEQLEAARQRFFAEQLQRQRDAAKRREGAAARREGGLRQVQRTAAQERSARERARGAAEERHAQEERQARDRERERERRTSEQDKRRAYAVHVRELLRRCYAFVRQDMQM